MTTSTPGWLADLVAPDYVGTIRYQLHKYLCQSRPARPIKTTHASDVIDDDGWYCSRRAAIMIRDDVYPADEKLATVDSVVYAHSADIADRMVAWCAEAGIAWGNWYCRKCQNVFLFQSSPADCPKCGPESIHLRHQEMRFISQISGISGSIDMMVKLPHIPKIQIVEIKAIQKSDFMELKMPLGNHRLRTNLYLRLIAESDSAIKDEIDQETARIVYVVKGGYGEKTDEPQAWGLPDKAFSPFKEFTVERDDEATQRFTDVGRVLAAWKASHGKGEILPLPQGICDLATCVRARGCEVVKTCFAEA